jgi:hypothetical protein
MPYLALSDGSYMEIPEGMTEENATKIAQEKYPELFPEYAQHQAKTGVGKSFTSTLKSGAGSAIEGWSATYTIGCNRGKNSWPKLRK